MRLAGVLIGRRSACLTSRFPLLASRDLQQRDLQEVGVRVPLAPWMVPRFGGRYSLDRLKQDTLIHRP